MCGRERGEERRGVGMRSVCRAHTGGRCIIGARVGPGEALRRAMDRWMDG